MGDLLKKYVCIVCKFTGKLGLHAGNCGCRCTSTVQQNEMHRPSRQYKGLNRAKYFTLPATEFGEMEEILNFLAIDSQDGGIVGRCPGSTVSGSCRKIANGTRQRAVNLQADVSCMSYVPSSLPHAGQHSPCRPGSKLN
jgi:hypothetical protein